MTNQSEKRLQILKQKITDQYIIEITNEEYSNIIITPFLKYHLSIDILKELREVYKCNKSNEERFNYSTQQVEVVY